MKEQFLSVITAILALGLISPSAQANQIQPDLDCDDFQSQQEAQAFFEHAPLNRAALDVDGDGIVCQHLPNFIRTDGRRVSGGFNARGWVYEVWQSSISFSYRNNPNPLTVYYVKAWRANNPSLILTTGNFASSSEAYQYFVRDLQ